MWSHLEKNHRGVISHVTFKGQRVSLLRYCYLHRRELSQWLWYRLLWVTFRQGHRGKHTWPVRVCICFPACVCVPVIKVRGGQGPSRWGAQRLRAHPSSDWVLEQAVLFSQCQLACCHLVTFKRQLQQWDWSAHKHKAYFNYVPHTHTIMSYGW